MTGGPHVSSLDDFTLSKSSRRFTDRTTLARPPRCSRHRDLVGLDTNNSVFLYCANRPKVPAMSAHDSKPEIIEIEIDIDDLTQPSDWVPPFKEDNLPTIPRVEDIDNGSLETIDDALALLAKLDGFIACGVGEHIADTILGLVTHDLTFDIASALKANGEVVRAKKRAMQQLGIEDNIDDIVITLADHYHLIRPLTEFPEIFIYLALDAKQSNLAMARFKLAAIAKSLEL